MTDEERKMLVLLGGVAVTVAALVALVGLIRFMFPF
jgi:hypothetical protein